VHAHYFINLLVGHRHALIVVLLVRREMDHNDDNDDPVADSLLVGNSFRSLDDDDEDDDVEERRRKRRKRLDAVIVATTNKGDSQQNVIKTIAATKTETTARNQQRNEQEDQMKDFGGDDDDDDNDGFDMFSKSVSPLSPEPPSALGGADATAAANNVAESQQRGGHEQQDWDDAEGYFMAVSWYNMDNNSNPHDHSIRLCVWPASWTHRCSGQCGSEKSLFADCSAAKHPFFDSVLARRALCSYSSSFMI
jgi:hypothetical protein